MTKEMKKEIAERMIAKVRMYQMYKDNYKENKRNCPFYSELVGIEEMLKLLGIEFEYTFDLDTMEITAVTVDNDIVIWA